MNQSPRRDGRIPHDYHMHTNVSCDSDATMIAMGRSALDCGVTEIAFTEHFDVHPKDSCTGFYQPDVYFANLEAARRELGTGGLTIRAGIELGEPHIYHAEQQSVLDQYPYDLVLGSLHWIGDEIVFDRAYFQSRTPEEAITPYLTELVTMVRAGGFDVLAHMDVFKRVGWQVYGGTFESLRWEDYIRPVWQACIESGIGVEINTASLRRGLADPHPALEALRWYRAMGGELLTLGSDAHRPQHVAFGFDTGLAVARAAGFTRVCRYERRAVVGWIAI
jgi:histidinol-phosphatase (PHP family)